MIDWLSYNTALCITHAVVCISLSHPIVSFETSFKYFIPAPKHPVTTICIHFVFLVFRITIVVIFWSSLLFFHICSPHSGVPYRLKQLLSFLCLLVWCDKKVYYKLLLKWNNKAIRELAIFNTYLSWQFFLEITRFWSVLFYTYIMRSHLNYWCCIGEKLPGLQ